MKAKKGDKVIIIADGSYHTNYTEGEIWDVFREGSDHVYACKNGDEKNYTLLNDHEYEVYKPKPALLFQIGDVVRIAPSSEYYCNDESSCNPKDVSGKIVEHKKGDYKYWVEWDNGNTNSYRDEDLFHYVLDASCKNPAPISKPPIKSGDKVMCIKDCVNTGEGKVYINKGEILTNVMICEDRVWFNEKPGIGNGNYPITCFEVYTGELSSALTPCSEIILNQFKVGDRIIATYDSTWWKKGALGIVVSTGHYGDGSFSFDEIDTFGNVKTSNWSAMSDNKFSLYTGELVPKSLSIKDGDTIICVKDCTNTDYASNSAPVFKGEVLTGTVVGSGNRLWCTEKPGAGKGSYPAECFQVHTGVEPHAVDIRNASLTEKSMFLERNASLLFNVGDLVVITKTNERAGGELGRIGKLTEIDTRDSDVPYRLDFSTGRGNWACEIRQATISEQLVYMSEKSERTHPMLVEKNPCMRVPIQSDCLHEPTENLEFQTPIIVKKPNKKRNLVIINN